SLSTSEPGAASGVPPVPLPPGRLVDLPGRGTTFVRDTGARVGAPTLVLLHGLGATGDLNWFPSFDALSRRFRVISIDHRGHGQGIRVGARFRLADCADDAAAVADVLGVERFIAVGYSMGGPIAQLTWYRHRDRVAGLVLCATSRNFRGGPGERVAFGVLPGIAMATGMAPPVVRRRLMQRVGTRLEDRPTGRWAAAELRRSDPASLAAAAAALGRFSSHEWIGDVDVPTAVVLTSRDQAVPPHRQQKLADAIPGATVHRVDGDHLVCALGAHRFVPVLVKACVDVATRAGLLSEGAPTP
ncbi:MAG: alpha/beta fold hydrolase, partial [Acidimicrobiia bacterium]|nr:alpha/beta fold hydrolase [Acidimicrobiia bacterium]